MATSADTNSEQAERPAVRVAMRPEPPHAAAATEHPDLPLWPGNDLPGGRWERRGDVLHEPSDGNAIWRLKHSPVAGCATLPPIDWEEGLERAQRAWADHVPEAQGGADVMWAVVVEDLETIDQVAPSVDSLPTDEALTGTSSAAALDLVNRALRDAAASDLQSSPEWQRIQSIRGAVGHLMTTIRERAGEYWKELRTDLRFQGFWKSVSIRTCEAGSSSHRPRSRTGPAGPLPRTAELPRRPERWWRPLLSPPASPGQTLPFCCRSR
jgi:hypothetical protein